MIKIWYSNKEFFVRAMYVNSRRENFYLWTDRPTIKTLTDTHVHVHTISDDEHIKLFNSVKEKYSDYHDKLLQKLYLKFNREMENPLSFYSGDKGKQFQSDLKAGKFDINHTSMSVGDIVQLENSVIGCNTHQNEYWIVCHDGFDKLKFDDINQVQFDEIRKKDEEYIPYGENINK